MIPALLTCVYVIYLYRSLNGGDATTSEPSSPAPGDAAALSQLTQRLNSLEERLQAIADATPPGRTQL